MTSSSAADRKVLAYRTSIKDRISRGYVLHIDFDYLIRTYGDISVRRLPQKPVGARYAMCVGTDGDATFWTLISSKDNEHHEAIPDSAKEGSWKDNGIRCFFSLDHVFVATRDMILDAHMQHNKARAHYEHSSVKISAITNWPDIPPVYPDPKTFVPLAEKPPTVVTLIRPEPPTVPVPCAVVSDPAPFPAPAPEVAALIEQTFFPSPTHPEVPMTSKPATKPAAKAEPAQPSFRESLLARVNRIVTNPRLTDEEVAALVDTMGADAKALLLNGFE